jgi:hypothetical protein
MQVFFVGVDRNLVVSPNKINFLKGGAAGKAVGLVLYVWDWVYVRDGASVKGSVVSTGPPTAVLLGHEMEGGRPWTHGSSGCTVLQHGVQLGLARGQVVRIKAAWAAGYWRAGRCADVMCGVARDVTGRGWMKRRSARAKIIEVLFETLMANLHSLNHR